MERTDIEKLSDEELLALYQKEKDQAVYYEMMQLSMKIGLNSFYGALSNEYFLFFDQRNAEAITTSGQLSIRWIADHINGFMNSLLKTKDVDYIIAIDTDSNYVSLQKLVDMKFAGKSTEETVDLLDKTCSGLFEPKINEFYQKLADKVNAYEQLMFMDREAIADSAIWTAKKKYAMRVYDNEGVRFPINDPYIKVIGLEIKKSNTPTWVRGKLKKALLLILDNQKTEKDVHKFIAQTKKEFQELEPEEISFPTPVNNLRKWMDSQGGFIKGTPAQTKAIITYNKFAQENEIDQTLYLKDGDKGKWIYIREPNPMQSPSIAFPGKVPQKMKPFLSKHIDYTTQFDKTFMGPLRILLKAIGWSDKPKATLKGFLKK